MAARFARDTIVQILDDREWTESEAARRWKVPQATLNGIRSSRCELSMQTLSTICQIEKWTPAEFFLQHPSLRALAGTGKTHLIRAIQSLSSSRMDTIGLRVGRLMHLGLASDTADLVDRMTALLEKVAVQARASS